MLRWCSPTFCAAWPAVLIFPTPIASNDPLSVLVLNCPHCAWLQVRDTMGLTYDVSFEVSLLDRVRSGW